MTFMIHVGLCSCAFLKDQVEENENSDGKIPFFLLFFFELSSDVLM
jgi:hypothetical protein